MSDAVAAQARSHHGGSRARSRRLARRLAGSRRHGRAGRSRARRRLRRRRIAAATGNARRRRPRHRAVARGRERMRRQGTGGGAGRRRHRSRRIIPTTPSISSSCRRLCRRRAARAWCSSTCCGSAATPSCRFRISATGGSDCRSRSAATCRIPTICLMRGTRRRTSTSAASRISASSAASSGAKIEEAVALNAWGRRMRLKMPWWFWNLFGEQAVFLLSRRG